MEQIITYILPNELDNQTFRGKIAEKYSTTFESQASETHKYYDTFDWSFYKKNLTLIRVDRELKLCDINTEESLEVLEDEGRGAYKFWWDFPEGSLKNRLREIQDVRALIKILDIEKTITTIRILNEDEKTVVRVSIEDLIFFDDDGKRILIHLVQIFPIRGYDIACENFIKFMQEIGVQHTIKNPFFAALEKISKEPGAYSSKINIQLDPRMMSHLATKEILKNLLSVMRQNEEGIKDDIDTEFLHDFRVSVRRTRSALSQIKGVFDPKDKDNFSKKFKNLGDLTNRMRDLDVYLLNEKRYRGILPDALQSGLDTFFNRLKLERKKELSEIIKFLNDETYSKFVMSWEIFLNKQQTLDETICPKARIPILNLAKEYIYTRYSKVIKEGRKIDGDTPDEKLHKLRIQCKKLRYLLEFFASLFPEKSMNNLIKKLKVIQGILGDFNDYSVQQDNLLAVLKNQDKKQKDYSIIAAAMGGLITHLYHQQIEVRQSFSNAFKDFSSDENIQLFEDLFK